jgi:hypothetical protein
MKTTEANEKEISALKNLFEMDGYFNDEFKGMMKQMEDNILNDYPLLCGTKFDCIDKKNEAVDEVDKLKGKIDELSGELKMLKESNDINKNKAMKIAMVEAMRSLCENVGGCMSWDGKSFGVGMKSQGNEKLVDNIMKIARLGMMSISVRYSEYGCVNISVTL